MSTESVEENGMNPDDKTSKLSSIKYKGERSVSVYTLSKSGSPKYQGKFDYRSFLMRIPDHIIVPYSPIYYPFPFLDVILPEFDSFLVLGRPQSKDGKALNKEVHHIVWKQSKYYKFIPYLFNFPLKYTKAHLSNKMLIKPKDYNQYELWQIRDHKLIRKVKEGSPDYQPPKKSNDDDGPTKKTNDVEEEKMPDFDSLVMMKIIPYEEFVVNYHVRIMFFYIGKKSEYIGSPIIFGIAKKEKLSDLLQNFQQFAPKWVNNCEMRFIMKRKSNNENSNDKFNYDNYILRDSDEDIPYFQIICKLIDKDAYLNDYQ